MAPKRMQRNDKFSNDSMAIDPTEHSVSNDKNGKENTSTPFLTQLFDSLSDSKPQSVDIISEATSPQKNIEIPVDINNKNNIKPPQESTQTPFLSQLFNRISNPKPVSETNDHTEFLTKTNSNDPSDSDIDKESKKTEIQESYISELFQVESKNYIDKEVESNNAAQLNSNINSFKQNLQNSPEDKVESVKDTSRTPFLSQLFNVLDNSSTFSGETNKKPDLLTTDESLDFKDFKGTTDLENDAPKEKSPSLSHLFDTSDHSIEKQSFETQDLKSNFQDKGDSSNTPSESPFLSQLFNSLSSSSKLNHFKKESDNINSNKSFDNLNLKVLSEGKMEFGQNTSDENDNTSKENSTDPSITTSRLCDESHTSRRSSNTPSESPFLSQLFNSLSSSSTSNPSKKEPVNIDPNQSSDKLNLKLLCEGKMESTQKSTKPFLTQLFGTLSNSSITSDQVNANNIHKHSENKSNMQIIDSKMLSNSQNQGESSIGDAKIIKDIGTAPFLSQFFDSVINKPKDQETSERDVKYSSYKVQGQERLLSDIKSSASQKKGQNCFRFDKDFYLNQLEIADALEDGSLKEIKENLTTGLVLAAKATGHLVGKIYEWIKMSYPIESEQLKLSELSKQLLMMARIIEYFDKTSFSKNEFEEWMTQLNFPYVFPANGKMLWSNVLKNDEFCRKIDSKFYERSSRYSSAQNNHFDREHEENIYFNTSKKRYSDQPFDQAGDEFDESYDESESPWNKSGSTRNQSNENFSRFVPSDRSHADRYGPSKDKFEPQRDNARMSKHQYGSNSNYKPHGNEHGPSWNQSDPIKNEFSQSRDQYGYLRNEFDNPKDQYGSTKDQSFTNKDQYGSQRAEFSHSKNDYGSKRGEFGVSRNEGQFDSSQGEFDSTQERLTPPVAHPNSLSREYYSHGGQQQGLPLHQTLSNVPTHHMLPPPPGPPPSIALPNMLGVLQPPPFVMPPSNIPYHDMPPPNFPPSGSHPPNIIPYTDYTQMTIAPPSNNYSNVSVPEEWIKAQKLLKSKGDLPPCPPASIIPNLAAIPITSIDDQNVSLKDTSPTLIPNSISQSNPYMATSNQINASSASQIIEDKSATSVSYSSNKKHQTSIQSTKKHKIDIKLKKKKKHRHHDENEDSKKSVYICCLPKGLGNEMMKKLLLVCGEVEEFHREIIDGIEAESCVVKFREVETVFKAYNLLNEFMILDSMLIVAVLNEKLFSDEDKEMDEIEILESKSAIDLLKIDFEKELSNENTEYGSSKRLLNDDDTTNKKLKVDEEEIYGPDCTDIELSNLDLDIGKILLVPVLEKCGGVVNWREMDGKIVFKYKNKQSAVIASQLLRELRIPDKYLQVNILSKEAVNLDSMEVDKGKKNTMKSWLNQAIVAHQEEFVNHLQSLCAMYRSNDFDPFSYKTKMCLEAKCTGKCESYHIPAKKDRRRDPRIYNYSDLECKHFREGKSCPEGDMCSKSHTENEREFHESRIHTSICQNWEDTKEKCDKKELCISAHPETPEVLFSEVWQDLFVCGLHQTYQYLEGSVHNLRNVKMEPGAIYVLVVSPSTFVVRWLTKAIRKLAGRHRLRVEEITEEKTAVDSATILIGTPDGIVKMMNAASYHTSYELNNLTCLILDDVSLLLNKHFKNMKNILSTVMKYSSKELNKIVVGEKVFQSEVDTLSLLLETKLTILGDILTEGGFLAPPDMKDEKKKEAKKQRHFSPEEQTTGGKNPRFRSPRSISPRSRSPRSRSPQSRSPRSGYRDISPRNRYRDHSPGSPRSRYRDYSPDSPTSHYKELSPNSSRSHYRDHSPGDPRSRYKRHSPGSPRARYRDNSPSSRSPRSRYRDFSPERGGPSRPSFAKYPGRPNSHYPPKSSGIRGPSRYPEDFPNGRGRGGPTQCTGPPMEINFPLVDHCYNLRSICDDLGLAGYTLRTIVVRALNLGPNPHRILQSLMDSNVFVQINKEATEFKVLEKKADNGISEENFKRAYIETKILIDYLKSTVHIGSVDQYGLNIRRIAMETLDKNIEYINENVKIHLRNARVTATPKNVFEILAVVLVERSIINGNRPKGSHHYDVTDDVGSDVDDDLEMVNAKQA